MARRKSSLERTYLCAVKFWGGRAPAPGTSAWRYRGTPTLTSGVRGVVRRQDFDAADVRKVERQLERDGLIETRGITVKLTSKGKRKARCRTVALAPWTDPQYGGSQLDGIKPKRRKWRKVRR